MRNLPVIITLVLSVLSLQALIAQDVATVQSLNKKDYVSSKDAIKVDRTGIIELSQFILRNADIPVEALGYSNEIRVNIQVSLNTKGEIINAHLVSGNKNVGKAVINSLNALKQVNPIIINGVPTAQTIQLPLIFTD